MIQENKKNKGKITPVVFVFLLINPGGIHA
jgi:hypothetical protein